MATTAEDLRIDGAGVASLLQQATEQLKRGEQNVVVDFTSVRRIDPRSLALLEQLAGEAGKRQIRIALCGVNVDIYKVMKLAQLAPLFTFQI
ncbi:MAG TPA: STAS domain-containing protein [Terriglobales bacterium]|nr:STAS domain-containing protein [Terriglobales bacterium]